MKIWYIPMCAIAALGLMASSCEKAPGQKASDEADANAYCKTNYVTKDVCVADVRCDWKLKGDGVTEVCRAK